MTTDERRPEPFLRRNILTPREQEILELVPEGWTAPEIGDHMNISARTVEHHLENLRLKWNAQNGAHLAARAFSIGRLKVVTPSPK